jgi:cell wall-associated NlpC family hydrolase
MKSIKQKFDNFSAGHGFPRIPNMNAYFTSQLRRQQLLAEADSWKETPFMPNGCIKGAGVSCQMLVGSIYIATGVWPPDFKIPEGPMDWSHAHEDSLITPFMADEVAAGRFEEVLDSTAAPGDLVGFKYMGCLHHAGIVLSGSGAFIHCMRDSKGVQYNNLRDATYLKRIERIWRPVEVAS